MAQARFLGDTGPDYITGPHQGKDKSQHGNKSHRSKSHGHENQQYPSIRTHSFFNIKLANEKSCINTDLKQSLFHALKIQLPSIFVQVPQIIFSIAGPLVNIPNFVFFRITFNKRIYNTIDNQLTVPDCCFCCYYLDTSISW